MSTFSRSSSFHTSHFHLFFPSTFCVTRTLPLSHVLSLLHSLFYHILSLLHFLSHIFSLSFSFCHCLTTSVFLPSSSSLPLFPHRYLPPTFSASHLSYLSFSLPLYPSLIPCLSFHSTPFSVLLLLFQSLSSVWLISY